MVTGIKKRDKRWTRYYKSAEEKVDEINKPDIDNEDREFDQTLSILSNSAEFC